MRKYLFLSAIDEDGREFDRFQVLPSGETTGLPGLLPRHQLKKEKNK